MNIKSNKAVQLSNNSLGMYVYSIGDHFPLFVCERRWTNSPS